MRDLDIAVISDVHLGTYGCHAVELLTYLKSINVETLILNGDFIETSQLRNRHFPKDHMEVIQYILRMAQQGTKVYYLTGNHDDAIRRYSDFSSGNVHIRDQLILSLGKKRLWFFHGDIFDASIKYSPTIAKWGEKGYQYLILVNRFINKVRTTLGLSKRSFAKKIKQSVKQAVKFISQFENNAMQLAADEGFDFVVCGHTHQPQMRSGNFDGRKITYLNSGDWVENLTALEYKWGCWSIFEYQTAEYESVNSSFRDLLNKRKEFFYPGDLEVTGLYESFRNLPQ